VETVTPGDGETFPKKGDKLTVNYVGKLTSGKEFDNTWKTGEPFKFRIGIGQVIRGWDEGLMKMSLGETARLSVTPDYGYAQLGTGAIIPADAHLHFEIQIVAIGSQIVSKSSLCSIQ